MRVLVRCYFTNKGRTIHNHQACFSSVPRIGEKIWLSEAWYEVVDVRWGQHGCDPHVIIKRWREMR